MVSRAGRFGGANKHAMPIPQSSRVGAMNTKRRKRSRPPGAKTQNATSPYAEAVANSRPGGGPVRAPPQWKPVYAANARPAAKPVPAPLRAEVTILGSPPEPEPLEAETELGDTDDSEPITTEITDADLSFESSSYKGLTCTKTIGVFKHYMKVCQGNICLFKGSAIVNAANEAGLGGGGVDGAISKAGGAAMKEARKKLPEIEPGVRIKSGTAVLTIGGSLPAGYVIHAVGPVYSDTIDPVAYEANDMLLKAAYKNSLKLAVKAGFRSITFPLICGGVFRGKRALDMIIKIGWATCFKFLKAHPGRTLTVCFVSFSEFEGQILRAIARETPHVPCTLIQRLCG